MFLKELSQHIGQLRGIGLKTSSHFTRLGIRQIADLLVHYPKRYLDRRTRRSFQDTYYNPGTEVNTEARVLSQQLIGGRNRQILKVTLDDGSGVCGTLVCFGRNFLAQRLTEGREIKIAGNFQMRYKEFQASDFVFEELDTLESPSGEFDAIVPVYTLTRGITQRQIRLAVREALRLFAFAIEDEVPQPVSQRVGLIPKKEALQQIHFPDSPEQLKAAHYSLVYEELFHLTLLIQRRRFLSHQNIGSRQAEADPKVGPPPDRAAANLPFQLSADQRDALAGICRDFTGPLPMNRLLQGDVGCGKTVVALLSTLPWLETDAQVVVMAPTEILAQQLERNMKDLLAHFEGKVPLGDFQIGFFSSSVTGRERKEFLEKLQRNELQLVFGTHALFSQNVRFANLRYIIVDEQHRFGVSQRLALKEKSQTPPHLLLMSATPIPRSLALTLYGDLDISSIRSLPEGRKPVKTHLARQDNDSKVYRAVRSELEAGRQAYFIYPLIAENPEDEPPDLRSLETMYRHLSGSVFPSYQLGMIHGQMKQEEKDRVMEDFRLQKYQILLATTVIEVGIDVPNASAIVIEHAERFGLAQLHQLRGRVGRSREQGYCFLVYREPLTPVGKERLKILKNSSDGFAIAEKDLELRGPGDLLGTQQSGGFELTLSRIPEDLPILQQANGEARRLIESDFGLLAPENQVLRHPSVLARQLEESRKSEG